MKLNKRIYLLTPILVICCILAAGIYVDKPGNVVADNAAAVLANDDITVYKTENYNPLTMEQVINASGTDKYEIANFDVNLFDYNGDAWNAFSAYQFLDTGFFLFRHGGINQYTSYELIGSNFKHPLNQAPFKSITDGVNIFENWGVNQNIRGIMMPNLNNGYPAFKTGVRNDGLGAGDDWGSDANGLREQMLFNPNKLVNFNNYNSHISGQIKDNWDTKGYAYKFDGNNDGTADNEVTPGFDLNTIRTAYKGSFQFLYDTTTGYYTYDSAKNHAQFEATELLDGEPNDNDGNGSIDGEVVLYADTLATTNYAADISDMLAMYNYYDTVNGERPNYGTATETLPYYARDKYGEERDDNAPGLRADTVHIAEQFGVWTLVKDTSVNYWDDVSGVKEFDLWQTSDNASNKIFAPTLKFDHFKVRANKGDYHWYLQAPMIDTFSTDDVEYIYVKFKVDNVPVDADLRFQVIYQGVQKYLAPSLEGYDPDKNFADTERAGKSVSEEYKAGEWVELYIPTKNWKEREITALSIVPFYVADNGVTKPYVAEGKDYDVENYETVTTPVDFWIQDLCLVYNLIEADGTVNTTLTNSVREKGETKPEAQDAQVIVNDGTVVHTNSNFLPFHKIQNSYIGFGRDNSYYSGLTGSYSMSDGYTKDTISEVDANSILSKWEECNSKKGNIRSQYANRSVSNVAYGQFSGGLGALGTNDYGGTASHFGMSMEVDFYIPSDGTTGKDGDGDKEYDDIVFEFLGDDDLWVFVDGQLVLDLGGCHIALAGEINFTQKTVNYFNDDLKKLTTINANGTVDTEDFPTSQPIAEDICKPGYHKLQIFYLERGSGVSNCYISFNLPQVPVGEVHVSKDVECKLSEKDKNNNDLQYSKDGKDVAKFQKDDFIGKLYDFKIAYSTEQTVTNWNSGITSALEYTLYQTDTPENKAGPFYTSSDGVFSVPVGWTACISVPEYYDGNNKGVTHVYVIELGKSDAGGNSNSSDKAYNEDWLPGNYEYLRTELKYYYLSEELNESNDVDKQEDLSNGGEVFASEVYQSIKDPIYFKFTNWYTWQIEFDTEKETEISEGDKSTTLDIDEDVKVTFENELGEENWLDGEGSADNKFGDKNETKYYPPKEEDSNSQN